MALWWRGLLAAVVVGSAVAVPSFSLKDAFAKRVEAVDGENPHHFSHHFHLRTGLGRLTHFTYDAIKHPQTIHPHYDEGLQMIGCTLDAVTLQVDAKQLPLAKAWGKGWHFTSTADHFPCPSAADGGNVSAGGPQYRRVVSAPVITATAEGATVVLRTEKARLSDFFQNLTMRMHSTHIMHDDPSMQQYAEQSARQPGDQRQQRRSLLSRESDGEQEQVANHRRLFWKRIFHKIKRKARKAAHWVKKHVVQPVESAVKLMFTGKLRKTWDKSFAMNWNYNSRTGGMLKPMRLHRNTHCDPCFFHADAGYKVEIDIHKYKLENLLMEVYGDVDIELGIKGKGPAVDVHTQHKVLSTTLFSVTFMLGPVPITVSLDLEVDVGLRFNVHESGETPHVTAKGVGHMRFGKRYTPRRGWAPINTHTLDFNLDSAGGTVEADLFLYANIVPKVTLHHIGNVELTITPSVDVHLTAALPKASCDYTLFQHKRPTCVASSGANTGCALGMSVRPALNMEMQIHLDIEILKIHIYKRSFPAWPLLQKYFTIKGFPKCLISSWSKHNGRRALGAADAGQDAGHDAGQDAGQDAAHTRTAASPPTAPYTIVPGSIRDPALADPRAYLQARGTETRCPKDCLGQGFCVNASDLSSGRKGWECACQEGWTGASCSQPVMMVADGPVLQGNEDGLGGITALMHGQHPRPAACGHEKVIHVADKVASTLHVCKGRTHPTFCASGDPSEMQLLDKVVGDALSDYVESGYACAAAMAELMCRVTFPAVLDAEVTMEIAPVSFESCVALFSPCMGGEDAAYLCEDMSAAGIARQGAGVAAPDSPWNTTDMPNLFDAEAEADRNHTMCIDTHGAHLTACPDFGDAAVFVNTDIWDSASDIDVYIGSAVAAMRANGSSDACVDAYRERLCYTTMPRCSEHGHPIKMRFDDCKANVKLCPSLADADPLDYGFDATAVEAGGRAADAFAAAVCGDDSDYFTRIFVGAPAATCGYDPGFTNLQQTVPTDKGTQTWSPMAAAAVAGVVGVVVGALAVVAVVVKMKSQDAPMNRRRESSVMMVKNPSRQRGLLDSDA